jgi:hypothetical protein
LAPKAIHNNCNNSLNQCVIIPLSSTLTTKHGQQKVGIDQVSLLLHSPSIVSRESRECLTTAARREDVRVEESIDGVRG